MKIFLKRCVLFFVFCQVLFSCNTINKDVQTTQIQLSVENYLSNDSVLWSKVTDEISIAMIKTSSEVSSDVLAHIVKIDFFQKNLDLIFSEVAQPQKKEKTIDFATQNNCLVAINASPFSYLSKKNKIVKSPFVKYRKIEGLVVINGKIVNPANPRYDVFVYNKESGFSVCSQKDYIAKPGDFAVGGFWIVLDNGKIIDRFAQIPAVRSVIGFSKDSKKLMFMSAKNCDFETSAKILKLLGCDYAIQMDGGSSSGFFVKDFFYKKNRVSVGNNIGVRYTKEYTEQDRSEK